MHRKEINERSPLRVLEKSIHGGLGRGNVGVVVARHGIGKTAFLVGVGLDDLMRSRKVFHLSMGQSVDRVCAYYDEILMELARERQMSTGMEAGIAIPHGRTDAVDSLVCAVGVTRDGVAFGSVDGKPAQIIIMALTPPTGADPYLQLAAAMIGVLDEEGRQRVLEAQDADELYQVLVGQ